MKGNAFGKCLYTACAVAGCMTGCWWYSDAKPSEIPSQISTNDNTLTGQAGDSVFFVQTKETMEELLKRLQRGLAELQKKPQETERRELVEETQKSGQEEMTQNQADTEKVEQVASTEGNVPELELSEVLNESQETELTEITQNQPDTEKAKNIQETVKTAVTQITPTATEQEEESSKSEQKVAAGTSELPSVAGHLATGTGNTMAGTVAVPTEAPEPTSSIPEASKSVDSVMEAFTYPAEIFGQVPVINRSDAYMSYFEFCYDLINMLEPVVEQQGRSMNALLTRFAIKALFSGVDIEQLNINAPIPRRQAALVLWLAAELLSEQGTATSSKSAQSYVTDILGCSSSEKKAIAYLYEQGIISGYNTAGQKFYPDAGLKTESGNAWLLKIKQCWR